MCIHSKGETERQVEEVDGGGGDELDMILIYRRLSLTLETLSLYVCMYVCMYETDRSMVV